MNALFLAAALAQAAPSAPAPATPAVDRDIVCWAAALYGHFLSRTRGEQVPVARDGPEERLREAMGYYLGVIRTRYPTDAALETPLRAGWSAFMRGDRARVTAECVTAQMRVLPALDPLIRPLITGQRR
jgi:hypothetical protein